MSIFVAVWRGDDESISVKLCASLEEAEAYGVECAQDAGYKQVKDIEDLRELEGEEPIALDIFVGVVGEECYPL